MERDPAVADRVTMMDTKRRLPVTTVLRDCSDLQKKGIPGGATSFQFRARSVETVVQSVCALGFVAISVDVPSTIAVNEIRQFGAAISAAIRCQNVKKR